MNYRPALPQGLLIWINNGRSGELVILTLKFATTSRKKVLYLYIKWQIARTLTVLCGMVLLTTASGCQPVKTVMKSGLNCLKKLKKLH